MVLHHIGYVHSDVEKAKAFYLAALGPLGYKEIHSFGQVFGLGANNIPDLWISSGKCPKGEAPDKPITKGVHLAFACPSKEIVDQCYAAAMCVHIIIEKKEKAHCNDIL
jgi:catechol 2,3-dioxygenase-like lactoylglutathione lyase family enzyme